MRDRAVLFALVLAFCLPVEMTLAASNPIPGVGIVVKRNPGTGARVSIPGGFFGPGSEPFDGFVAMEGLCSHNCGGCDNDCAGSLVPDGRLDYSTDANTGPFEVSMAATTMYSIAPIEVSIDGVPSFFDVFVELSGPGPESDDAIPGMLVLAPGESLDNGTSATVADGTLGISYAIKFVDHSTGDFAGAAITGDLEAILKNLGLLTVARMADGTPTGHIVLGFDGLAAVAFEYASANDELVIKMLSLLPSGPVSTDARSLGAVKAMYR